MHKMLGSFDCVDQSSMVLNLDTTYGSLFQCCDPVICSMERCPSLDIGSIETCTILHDLCQDQAQTASPLRLHFSDLSVAMTKLGTVSFISLSTRCQHISITVVQRVYLHGAADRHALW
jgi:hypothetical protein